jgi:CheY-like chemotaxis protein
MRQGDFMSVRKTILIVEDDPDIRSNLQALLELEGYRVLTATHGRAALDILAAVEKPSLIFLDIMMPVMDGREFLKVAKNDIALAPIPVVVISTYGPNEVQGADAYIKMPFELNRVLQLASQHCS